jgi:hypothetical protein
MLVREIQISCLLASAFTFSILNYADDTALARPVHQRTEINQSTGKSARVGEARPTATGRRTDTEPSHHVDSKQVPTEPIPDLVHREHGQVQFKPPSLHHNFTPLPRPPVRRDLQPVARNSIGMSVPSYSAKSRITPLASYSHPIGGPNIRPITPDAAGARVVSLPTSPRTAAISGTGVMHRGVGPSQIGGPAH